MQSSKTELEPATKIHWQSTLSNTFTLFVVIFKLLSIKEELALSLLPVLYF